MDWQTDSRPLLWFLKRRNERRTSLFRREMRTYLRQTTLTTFCRDEIGGRQNRGMLTSVDAGGWNSEVRAQYLRTKQVISGLPGWKVATQSKIEKKNLASDVASSSQASACIAHRRLDYSTHHSSSSLHSSSRSQWSVRCVQFWFFAASSYFLAIIATSSYSSHH